MPSRYVTPVYGAKMQYATQDEIPPFRTNNALPSKKSLAQFYITHIRLIQQCLYPSMTLQQNKQQQRGGENRGRPTIGLPGHAP
jgi:hypothetical protein